MENSTLFGIDIKRLAVKAVRDFIATFIGSSAFIGFTSGGVFNPEALGIAAGASASIALTRVLRDLGVPGMGSEK